MDGRLARGAETRTLILRRAADLASVDGLDGLTIGQLAADLNLSKSGVFALFGSKEALQLATIDHATGVFMDLVLRPAEKVEAGLPRLLAIFENWMDYSRTRVFQGGCFVAAVSAEFGGREGALRDRIRAVRDQWYAMLRREVVEAVERGHLDKGTDPDQVLFEVNALLRAANHDSVFTGSNAVYDRAAAGIRARLVRAGRN